MGLMAGLGEVYASHTLVCFVLLWMCVHCVTCVNNLWTCGFCFHFVVCEWLYDTFLFRLPRWAGYVYYKTSISRQILKWIFPSAGPGNMMELCMKRIQFVAVAFKWPWTFSVAGKTNWFELFRIVSKFVLARLFIIQISLMKRARQNIAIVYRF